MLVISHTLAAGAGLSPVASDPQQARCSLAEERAALQTESKQWPRRGAAAMLWLPR